MNDKYNPENARQGALVVISKCDMLDDELKMKTKSRIRCFFKEVPYMFISPVLNKG
jgi:GTP-binding protein